MGGSAILQQRHRNKKKKEVWLALGNRGVIDPPHSPALPKHALKSSGTQKPDLVLLILQCQVT